METKRCFKCGRVLPLTEFYRHPFMPDGHFNKCKDCTKKDVHNNYKKNLQKEGYLEKERERGRDKYKRLYSNGRAKKKAHKENSSTHQYYSRRGVDIGEREFHHWNYNLRNDVFAISRQAHKLAHKFLTFDNGSGMFYYNGVLLKTKAEHRACLEKIFDGLGYQIEEYDL